MDIYEKALAAGLDPMYVRRSQQSMRTGMAQQVAIHEALDRVILFAMSYDRPGEPVRHHNLGLVP